MTRSSFPHLSRRLGVVAAAIVSTALAALVFAAKAGDAAPPKPDGMIAAENPPKWRLADPADMPELVRHALKRRMARHGVDMSNLVLTVALLKYDEANELATKLATEPRIARPAPGSEDEWAALPERFFVLQDELRARSKTLAQAAKAKNDPELAAAFGRVTETCVACHATYLRERPR